MYAESTKVVSAKRPRCMRIDLYANRLVCETTSFQRKTTGYHSCFRVLIIYYICSLLVSDFYEIGGS